MLADESRLEGAIRQWRTLHSGDRKAILQRLPAEQRLAFQRLLAEAAQHDAAEAARGRRYRAYSPWLAELIESCENGDPAAQNLPASVRTALLAGHETIHAVGNRPVANGPLGDVVQRVTRWFGELR